MNFKLLESTAEGAYAHYSDPVDLVACGVGDSISLQSTIDVDTPSAKTFDSGESEVTTLTFDTQANTDAGDYVVIYDTEGEPWAVAADLTGADPEPTGAVWTAIPAGQKAQADLQAAVSAADVAAAFELAFDALVGVPFTTDDSAADGTMVVTVTLHGPTDDAETFNEDDSGAGSIAAVETTPGVVSEVNIDDNEITIPAHGLTEGLKGQLTTTGTLPAGLSLATDYYVIVVDANTIKLATSLANAQAGTAVNITNQGSDGAVNTFTPTALAGGTIQLQQSNDGVTYVNLGSSTNITVDTTIILTEDNPKCRYYRAAFALTAGHLSSTNLAFVKNNTNV